MTSADGLLRVFWPSDAPRSTRQGTIIGWRNSPLDIFVVSILQEVETKKVENALQTGILYRNAHHPTKRLFNLCGHSWMGVLGTVNPHEPSSAFDPNHLQAFTQSSSAYPRIVCPSQNNVTVQVVIYHRPAPHQMQYMSLTPIPLVLGDKPLSVQFGTSTSTRSELDEEAERVQRARLLEKLKLHTVVRHPPSRKEILLPNILTQINCSKELAILLDKNVHLIKGRSKRIPSVSEQVVKQADLYIYALDATWQTLAVQFYPLITKIFVVALIIHRSIAEVVLCVLEWRPRQDSAALKDISATAQQIDIRLQQFCYWPIQWITLQKRRDDWESVTDRHPDYIRFFNSLWLVANDVIIGIALGSYIIDNAHWVALQIDQVLNGWTVDGLRDMILWLMDWPAGLKLNTELAKFLGDLFLWVIDIWRGKQVYFGTDSNGLTHSGIVGNLNPLLPHIIYFIGFASFAGATMPISMFSDLLSLLTVHIYCFYTASARIFHWQLTIIMSLFHLFRGKKHNVLRNRIDSCDYDLDQLLLGTILFSLLFFLLPTVMVFYLTFTTARMAIIFLMAALDTLLACLNHFPLFALMLRVKDSRRLPGQSIHCPRRFIIELTKAGGICFELQDTPAVSLHHDDSQDIPPTSYIILKVSKNPRICKINNPWMLRMLPQSVPLSLRAMFDQYFQLGQRIRRHYLSPSVVWCLMTGQFLPRIHRKSLYSLQYSMLPARRAGVWEVWNRLNEKATTTSSANGFPKGSHASLNGTRSRRP